MARGYSGCNVVGRTWLPRISRHKGRMTMLRLESTRFRKRAQELYALALVSTSLNRRTHLVEGADHAALEDRPKTLDRVCTDCADNVLTFGVVNGGVRKFLPKMLVAY